MIWPFKKREPAIPFEEYAMTLPKPPCGDSVTHYEWEKVNGIVCPLCHANRKREQQNIERGLLAVAIVAEMEKRGLVLKASSGVPVPRRETLSPLRR
jgi:hypothetical protein